MNEAASNIMKHAYHGRADQRIQLEAEACPDRVSIRLHHLGDSFDPAGVAPPALDGSRESGFGVYLITRSVDEVRYSRDDRGRNCIALVKILKRGQAKDIPMDLVLQQIGDVAVATVPVEELDASNAGEFKRDIAPVLEANAKLVLDLSRLRFVDSSGLGAFISCLRKLNAKGGDLKLCGMSKQVRAVFELVRMHRVFDICATSEDAVRAFGAKVS